MTMQGVKFRAYSTREQAKTLSRWIGCARVIYNCKVREDKQNRKSYALNGEKINLAEPIRILKLKKCNG